MDTAHNSVQAILILHKYTNDAKQLRFCSKKQGKMQQNAVQSAAKRSAKRCKTQGKMQQNAR